MNIVLWILQLVLAVAFLASGLMKLTQSKEKLARRMAWAQDYSQEALRGIGVAEVLGAIGLVLPEASGIATWLTPLAALGLVLLMIGAIRVHLRRHETSAVPPPAILLALSAAVAVGRL